MLEDLPLQNNDIKNKKILMRVDFDMPLDGSRIIDDSKIRKMIPVIKHILNNNAKLILVSHLGEPNGELVPALSLIQVAKHLSSLMKQEIKLAPDTIGDEVVELSNELKPGSAIMLENTSFHSSEILFEDYEKQPAETKARINTYIRELANLGEIFINKMPTMAQKQRASIQGVEKYFRRKRLR